MKKTVVLGIGNELFKDEGVGVHAARTLQTKLPSPGSNIEIIDGGTSPDIWSFIDGAEKLVIVDAVRGDCEPGTIYRFTPQQIVADRGLITSVHQMGILENLSLMELVGSKPKETIIIGVEPAELEPGLELSAKLQERMPKILQTVLGEIHPRTETKV
jgi:hydrogenase maturation protease